MKKFLVIAAAALLMFGLTGQANAYFSTGDLIRVMYDSQTGVEIGTDLGAITTLQGASNYTLQAAGASNTVALSSFGATATWGQVDTAYFAESSSSVPGTGWIAAVTTPTDGSRKGGSLLSGLNTVMSYYTGLGATATVSGSTTNPSSYVDLGLSGGNYGSFLTGSTNSYGAEVNNAIGGTQNLYSWALTSSNGNQAGTLVSSLSIVTLDGTTTINPQTSATPIPPSVLLMGTGLLGLVGIGRRKFFG